MLSSSRTSSISSASSSSLAQHQLGRRIHLVIERGQATLAYQLDGAGDRQGHGRIALRGHAALDAQAISPLVGAIGLLKAAHFRDRRHPFAMAVVRQNSKASMTKALIAENVPGKPAIITGLSPRSQRLGAFFCPARPRLLPAT
jgi:hypothetical protein